MKIMIIPFVVIFWPHHPWYNSLQFLFIFNFFKQVEIRFKKINITKKGENGKREIPYARQMHCSFNLIVFCQSISRKMQHIITSLNVSSMNENICSVTAGNNKLLGMWGQKKKRRKQCPALKFFLYLSINCPTFLHHACSNMQYMLFVDHNLSSFQNQSFL